MIVDMIAHPGIVTFKWFRSFHWFSVILLFLCNVSVVFFFFYFFLTKTLYKSGTLKVYCIFRTGEARVFNSINKRVFFTFLKVYILLLETDL